MNFNVLNKITAKIATFVVKLVGGRVSRCPYPWKKGTTTVTATKFEVWIVVANPEFGHTGS